jgi:acyl-CoA reductase-like NAD-dependent aldehyde dehydrogenase
VGKIAPALVTGNTIIVKPSPFTPYCGLKIVELAQQFFPPGVVQGLSGDDNLGPWITAHPGIDKISFTGSTATGKKVMESASKTLKRITLELGGNDPAIICKDVDISVVAPKIAQLAFLNSGQICVALKRVYIHESIYSEFCATMVEATKKMQVGNGFADGVFLGPIQNEMQYNRVRGFFDDIEKQGQQVAVGGTFEDSQGYFVKPTIIDNPSETSRLVLEEPFGKYLSVHPIQ